VRLKDRRRWRRAQQRLLSASAFRVEPDHLIEVFDGAGKVPVLRIEKFLFFA
jgi:hypothetical protein